MIKKHIILFILFAFPTYLFSQYSPEIDSLIDVTSKMSKDTNKAKNLNTICWKLKTKDFDVAVKYGEDAIKLSQELEFKSGEALAYKNLGGVYYLTSNYPISYDYYTHSLEVFQEIGDSINIAKVIRNIGSIYHQQGNYEKALEYFFQSLELRKNLDDEKGMASLYNAIGLVYLEQGEEMFNKALEYFNKALEIYLLLDNKKGIAQSYNRIGTSYISKTKPKYDTALIFYDKFLNIANELGENRMIAQANESIGSTYLKKEDSDIAYQYLIKSLELWKELGNSFGVGNGYINLGEYYSFTKDYSLAIKYFIDAIDIAKQIEAPIIERNASRRLAEVYQNVGNYEKALDYNNIYHSLKDSLQGEEVTKQIAQFESQLDFKEMMKEKELEKQRNQLEHDNKLKNQKIISYATLLGLILMIILSIVIFRSYRTKKNANVLLMDKNNEIETQKAEIEAQRDQVVEQNEKISLQQAHISASIRYAKHIQTALLPPTDFLNSTIPEHFLLFKPRDVVSGDFYWAVQKENISFIAAADCTGHGVPGAFMSMLGISFLNEIVNKNPIEKLSAANILNQLRTYIKTSLRQTGKENETKDGMDIALCTIDFDKNIMQFAGAQNPLIIIRDKEIIQYKGDRMPIGIHIVEKPFTNHTIDIIKNDCFYIFSDGFIDQFGGIDNKKFMIRNFKNLLLEINNKSMSEQNQILETTLSEWIATSNDFDQIDDILVIGIKI